MRACWVATPARLGPSCPTNAPRRNKLCALEPEQQLFSSLRRQFDVDGENVAVSSGPVGRGLFFTTDTDKDTTIKIPIRNTLLVTDDPVGGSCIVGDLHQRAFQDIHGAFPELLQDFLTSSARWEVRLCAWLLWLIKSAADPEGPLHQRSPWRAYIQSLPHLDDLSTLLSYSPLEQRALIVPKYIRESEIQRDVAQMFHYTYFYGLKATLGSLRLSSDVNHTIWAMSLVRSRSFGHTINFEDVTIMAPFLDIANHSSAYNSSFRTTEDGEYFELFTFEHCNRGDELMISYGADKCNFELMRDYGFVLEGSALSCDRIHFVYECQRLLRDRGGASEGAELAAAVTLQARTHFMDEVTDGSYNERAISTRYPNSEGLSFELLAAALSEYRPIGHGLQSYEKAALRSLEPLISCTSAHVDSADIVTALMAICRKQADNGVVETLSDAAGEHAKLCKQEDLAREICLSDGLEKMCLELLEQQKERKAAQLPDAKISPHRQQAADLASFEHFRVLVAICRLFQTYTQYAGTLTERRRG